MVGGSWRSPSVGGRRSPPRSSSTRSSPIVTPKCGRSRRAGVSLAYLGGRSWGRARQEWGTQEGPPRTRIRSCGEPEKCGGDGCGRSRVGTGGGSATTGGHGDRVGTGPQRPEPIAREVPVSGWLFRDGHLGVAISGCRRSLPAELWRGGRTAGRRAPPSPPISPRQPDGADSTDPARTGHHPQCPLPQGRDSPNRARAGAAAAPCRAMALARDRGHGGHSPRPSEPGVSLSLSPVPSARPGAAAGLSPARKAASALNLPAELISTPLIKDSQAARDLRGLLVPAQRPWSGEAPEQLPGSQPV